MLYSSVLTGGLLLVNGMTVAPAYAAACSTASNTNANVTTCIGGSSNVGLTYVTSSNPAYVSGDFTLQLQSHDVTAGAGNGILFSGVQAGNDGTILLDGNSNVSGTLRGIESSATNATTTIKVNGTSSVSGATGPGINAISFGGDITVTTQAGTTVTGVSSAGIVADATAAGNVVVEAEGGVDGGVGSGIVASAATGTVDVTTGANEINGGVFGIDANATASTVTVTTGTGLVVATGGTGINATGDTVIVGAGGSVTGTGGTGINAVADVGTVNVTTAAGFTVQGTGGNGINAEALGDVTVDPDGNVSGSTNGINAVSNALGNVNVVTAAGTTVSGASDGINAETQAAGNTGNVVVDAQSAVTSTAARGIDANAIGGTVKVTTGAAVSGFIVGIDATASGAVTVNAGGNVTGGINAEAQNGLVDVDTAAGFTVESDDLFGIRANANVTGDVDVDALSVVTGGTIGIYANATAGTVNVTTGTAAVAGNTGNGIDATASGAVTVGTSGNVTGTGGTGINAVSSAAGIVNVTTGLGTTVSGTTGDGINAATTGAGTIVISNGATTEGFVTGIDATSGGGNITINNNTSVIRNLSQDDAALAIHTTGGATAINNDSRIIGRVETDAGVFDDVLNTNALWQTEGPSDFGGGNDTVNNNFIINGANELFVTETTTFANLETLNNNAGAIDLSEQTTGDGSNVRDTLSTSGNYAGNGGNLDVDAFLGGAGSLADVLAVGGSTSGLTTIFVVADTNAGAGAFNPTGILVVDGVAGNTAAEHFELANGPIDKGLFFYDLLFDAAEGDHLLVGLPDREVFETLAAVSSAQEIWRETADAWSTRQENLRDTLAASHVVTAVADPAVVGSDAPMGSLWVSALGSWAERDDDASFSLLNANLEFDTSYKQDIYGVVGGADFRTEMGADSSLLFGLMAGYVDSSLDFDEGSSSIDTNGATVGAYAALLSNGFFATILVKADLLNMDYTAGSLAEDDNDDADVTSIGARGDFGYRFGDTLFFEPMLSVDGLSTKIDEFSIGGVDIDAGTNESFRAGAGVRAGFGGETFRASATARVWDVFSTDNEVDILSGVPLGISDDDLEGVYGDFSGQVDVNLSANTTVYLKGGVLFSDDTTKPNASGGFAFFW